MRLKLKSLIILVTVLLFSVLFYMINLNYVGKKPVIYRLSSSVASRGDKIVLTGNYFGGDVSRGRVYIDGQMVYKDFIKSWNQNEIVFILPDDFSSGMITVVTMFGKSNPYLITSLDDVPVIINNRGLAGYPNISSITYAKNSNLKVILEGSGFGINRGSSYIEVEEITGKRVNFKQSAITLWQDDRVEFYLPYVMNNISISIINYRGRSNEIALHNSGIPSVVYVMGPAKRYTVNQKLDIESIVTLKESLLEVFLPGVFDDINQRRISSTVEEFYDIEDNLYHYISEVEETGESLTVEVSEVVEVSSIEAKVRMDRLSGSYDKSSPDYIEGFVETPDVVIDNNLRNTATWLVRNTSNRYSQAELLLSWILRYVKFNESALTQSDTAFTNRAATSDGLIYITAAMFRSVGIPTKVIGGVKISENVQTYKWLEIYLPGGGWIPVDVSSIREDKSYPMGKIDGDKICFSKGYTVIDYEISSYDSKFYALQNCITKSQGNVESYYAMWHNVNIIELQE